MLKMTDFEETMYDRGPAKTIVDNVQSEGILKCNNSIVSVNSEIHLS